MGTSPVSIVLVVLGLSATLGAGPTGVHAAGNHAQDEDTTTAPDSTTGGQDGQCSPLQRRQDLLDKRLTERDADLNTLLNDLNSRLNGVDARLNRIDGRFDDLEKAMSGESASTAPSPTTTTEVPQVPKDCQEAYTMGLNSSGIYRIAPEPGIEFEVLCDQELDGGGWLVFQLRKDGTEDFYKDWKAYKVGFGELTGEFWLGNSKIHLLTKDIDQQLKVQLTDPEGEVKYADYKIFWIEDETRKFQLGVTGFSGGSPPGDSLTYHNGQKFSTRDQDNDVFYTSCARRCTGAWWYKECLYSNLNGQYGNTESQKGVNWYSWKGNHGSMKSTKMMIRKKR